MDSLLKPTKGFRRVLFSPINYIEALTISKHFFHLSIYLIWPIRRLHNERLRLEFSKCWKFLWPESVKRLFSFQRFLQGFIILFHPEILVIRIKFFPYHWVISTIRPKTINFARDSNIRIKSYVEIYVLSPMVMLNMWTSFLGLYFASICLFLYSNIGDRFPTLPLRLLCRITELFSLCLSDFASTIYRRSFLFSSKSSFSRLILSTLFRICFLNALWV